MREDYASKRKGLIWLLVACLLGVALGGGLKPIIRATPWSWEKHMARLFPTSGRACENPQAQKLLQQLVSRLYPLSEKDRDVTVTTRVVRQRLMNAYASLGGHITLHSALLEKASSPEELAGVLAHEIGHVERRHVLQGFAVHLITVEGMRILLSGEPSGDWARVFLNMTYSRAMEREADHRALIRLQQAEIDNRGLRNFFLRLGSSHRTTSLFSSHPSSAERIAIIDQYPNGKTRPIMTQDEWQMLKGYCGI